jgi:hypothetical protein
MEELISRLKTREAGVPGRFYTAGICLENERNLGEVCWNRIADKYLAGGAARSLPEIEADLVVIFRDFQLLGGLDPDKRGDYGRAMKRHVFFDILTSHHWPSVAVDAVLRKLPLFPAPDCRALLRGVDLGRYFMWSTFCAAHTNCDPFDPRNPNEDLLDDLGLMTNPGDEFYLFWYGIPTAVDIRLPTVADAYSGEFFFPFRPDGRTFPIQYQDRLAGRPERVHKLIKGENLKDKIAAIRIPPRP